jgi:hypothetical protein
MCIHSMNEYKKTHHFVRAKITHLQYQGTKKPGRTLLVYQILFDKFRV